MTGHFQRGTQVRLLPSDFRMTDKNGGSYRGLLRHAVLLHITWPDKRWAGFVYSESTLERATNELRALEVADSGHTNMPDKVRLIGPTSLINSLRERLPKSWLANLAIIQRPCLFEAVWDGSDFRMRASGSEKVRVLVVDDSKSMRLTLRKAIELNPDMEVCGEAESAEEVLPLVDRLFPDCITLDINMPGLSGVDLLRQMPADKFPRTLIVSSLRKESSPQVLEALELGAIDYCHKPDSLDIHKLGSDLGTQLRFVANALVTSGAQTIPSIVPRVKVNPTKNEPELIAIGSSTGGTEALKHVLTALPGEIPPIVIAQHIPAVFSAAFAQRMDSLCSFKVVEGVDGMPLQKGHVYVAPGSRQMRIVRRNKQLFIAVDDEKGAESFSPSVNHLFRSVAACEPRCAIAVILTGMGRDGTDGLRVLKEMAKAKGREIIAIAQDEQTSVVWGMPGEATKSGRVDHVLPLGGIAPALISLFQNSALAKSAASNG